eukprot:scaffold127311_cov25-Tisochrysis_lutea.AAC.1
MQHPPLAFHAAFRAHFPNELVAHTACAPHINIQIPLLTPHANFLDTLSSVHVHGSSSDSCSAPRDSCVSISASAQCFISA